MNRKLEVAKSFSVEVLEGLGQYRSVNLRDPEQAEYFMAMVFPELAKKIQLAEENIDAARRGGEGNPPLEAAIFRTKGWLYHFAMKPARSERLASRKDLEQLGETATEALETALRLSAESPDAGFGEEGAAEFRDSCLWTMAGVANSQGNRTREIEILREVETLDAKHSIEATKALQELEAEEEAGKGCFIATAVYEAGRRNELLVLRRFRDQSLERYRAGRAIVRSYYRVSPPIALWLAGGRVRRRLVRAALSPLVLVAGYLVPDQGRSTRGSFSRDRAFEVAGELAEKSRR